MKKINMLILLSLTIGLILVQLAGISNAGLTDDGNTNDSSGNSVESSEPMTGVPNPNGGEANSFEDGFSQNMIPQYMAASYLNLVNKKILFITSTGDQLTNTA
jgi:hypothetical protein